MSSKPDRTRDVSSVCYTPSNPAAKHWCVHDGNMANETVFHHPLSSQPIGNHKSYKHCDSRFKTAPYINTVTYLLT